MARRTKEQVKADNELIERIRQSLETNPKAVCRAIMLLQRKQTADEQNSHATLQSNGVGFSMTDANYGSFLASVIAREGSLRGKLLTDARRLALKYHRTQLFQAAKERQNADVPR
jgi:hypothetical protein